MLTIIDKEHLSDFAKKSALYSVLFVEDDETVRMGIEIILKQFFKNVYTAYDGVNGLEIYERYKPDIVISDITMPRMNGLEMSSKIKKILPTQKIIISSAHQDIEHLLESIEIGVDGYILKPIQKNQFLYTVSKAVDQINVEKENENYQKNLELMVEQQVCKIKKQSEMMVEFLKTDKLTGVGNKKQLELDFKERKPSYIAFLNIDNFSQINISYGFSSGDLLLIALAKYVCTFLDNKALYRVAGDEFCIIFYDNYDEVYDFVVELKKNIYKENFLINDISLRISVTIGIVKIDDSCSDVPYGNGHLLVKNAKESRRNSVAFFEDDLSLLQKQRECLAMGYSVKYAIENDTLVPFFQPIVDIKTGHIDKYECLARIKNKDSYISPYYFIDAAKVSGVLPNLTRIIIEKSFIAMSGMDVNFSLNITDDDLKEEYLEEYLDLLCKRYAVEPSRVILEVLENISNYDTKNAIEQLKRLKSKGFYIAIDDFGADSSNFERVQKLNVDFIKIDGSFIKDIDSDENSLNIVKTIVYYAKLSNMKVIAEYVHNQDIFEIVKSLDIDYAQGYYLSEPKPTPSKV
ncbi:MAG: EAL domain-containing protein [Campylobacterales bacterium]|nr:EAL domain-containing protein [Campylobacterales bacterium]